MKKLQIFFTFVLSMILSFNVLAKIPADVQEKLNAQVAELVELAKNPTIIAASKAGANDKSMNNARWQDIAETDTAVTSVINNQASNLLEKHSTPSIAKIYLRDAEGLWVAGKTKPFIYNLSNRPNYKKAITGENFIAPKIQKDPSTGEDAVQVAVPVFDNGKVVGVLHAGIKP